MSHLPTPTRSRLTRHILLASLLGGAPLLLAMPAALAYASEQTRHYAIPAGGLDQALNRFASQSGILLSADAQLTAGKHTPAQRHLLGERWPRPVADRHRPARAQG